MKNRTSVTRHTGPLVTDPQDVAHIEARNALVQFDEVCRLIPQRFGNLQLTPTDICSLQKLAVQDIYACAGQFRKIPIGIKHTTHEPPPWQTSVLESLEAMPPMARQVRLARPRASR
jgi:hypothetical protein